MTSSAAAPGAAVAPRAGRAVPHPEVQALAARFAAAGVPTYDTLTVAAARDQLEGVTRLQKPAVPLAQVTDVPIAVGPAGPVPARVYRPDLAVPGPVVVYLHGGGWVLGSLDAADRPCRSLAAAAGCTVISVDYRRAPETRFPGALEDCCAAVRRVLADPGGLGGTERVVLLGDSAGGNLAAATSMVLRDEGGMQPAAQVLLYPTLAPARTTWFGSYAEFADGPLTTRRELNWFWAHYLRDEADATDPLAAPLHAPDLTGLPPTTVVVAELDPLRDEGRAYAGRLAEAGVPVELHEVAGAAHGFWWLDRALSAADELTAALVPVLRGSGTLALTAGQQ